MKNTVSLIFSAAFACAAAFAGGEGQAPDPRVTMQQLRDDLVEFAPEVPNNSYGEVRSIQYSSSSALAVVL